MSDRTLFIDLASHAQSIALVIDGNVVATQAIESKSGEERLLPLLETMLEDAKCTLKDVTKIATVTGPGGFMSLRVGISLANALSDSLHIPLAGIHQSDLWAARIIPHPPTPSPEGGRGALQTKTSEWHGKNMVKPPILTFAREMRKDPTSAESLLWSALRDKNIGFKFRRQHPIQSRILDFYCHEAKLGIELDGTVHSSKGQQIYDSERTIVLKDFGIRILRFNNAEIVKNMQHVLDKIHDFLLSPLPSGEGSGVRVLWVHSTKREQLFVRGLGQGFEGWKEPTLETVEAMQTMITHPMPYVGELIESQQTQLPHLQRSEKIKPLNELLPTILEHLAYDQKPLQPWYGRGA